MQIRPFIVGTLLGNVPFKSQLYAARQSSVDLIELRLDSFKEVHRPLEFSIPFFKQLVRQMKHSFNGGLLITLRGKKDSGQAHFKDVSRLTRMDLLKALLPSADWVDIELRSSSLSGLTRLAKRNRVKIIHSYHDFHSVCSIAKMQALAKQTQRLGGDVLKLAVTPKRRQQLEVFLNWGLTVKKPKLALIGMGRLGEISRYIGFTFGSVFTFGHLGSAAAPGQPSVSRLKQFISKAYGKR